MFRRGSCGCWNENWGTGADAVGARAGTEGVDTCVVGAGASAVGAVGAVASPVGATAGTEGVDTSVVGAGLVL